MAPLSEKHPTEAKIARDLLRPFRFDGQFIHISHERADDLEMRITEALYEAFCHGVESL